MPSPQVRIGEILAGKYRVERVLGVGAMGVVVAATHIDLHELRAIKMMLPSMLGDTEGVERFLREARAVSKLRSRHVAAVYDVGRFDSGAPFIVMEYLEGSDLKSVLDQRGVLTPGEAAAYVSEACEALSEAHGAGIIHRDIKPANLFLATQKGGAPTIKLLDFGIAKMDAAPGSPAAMDMTRTNEILGTPLYMSPEQMRSMRRADARSDVWSLGVILYRAVTGKVPFHGETITEVCMAVLGDTPARPSALRPDLPSGFDAVILGCLEKDPASRIGSAAALATALAPFVLAGARPAQPSFATEHSLSAGAPSNAVGDATSAATLVWKPLDAEGREQTSTRASWTQTGKSVTGRSRRPWILGATGLLALGLAILGGWRLLARPSGPPASVASAALAPTALPSSSASAARPAESAPTVLPVAPAKDPPIASATATASAIARGALPAPRASAAAKTPAAPVQAPPAPPAPPPPTGDIFGGGRY
jgi:serine/threonine-protein kinase